MICLDLLTIVHYCNCTTWYQVTSAWLVKEDTYVRLINCRAHLFRTSASSFNSQYLLLFLKIIYNDIYFINKGGKIETQKNIGNKWVKILRKIRAKQKYKQKKSQHIRESFGIQPINEWMERIWREWDEHVSRMVAERLVKISRENIPAWKSPRRLRRRWSDLIPF
jgi:hypothetical protein